MYLFPGMGEKCNFCKIRELGMMIILWSKGEFSREMFSWQKKVEILDKEGSIRKTLSVCECTCVCSRVCDEIDSYVALRQSRLQKIAQQWLGPDFSWLTSDWPVLTTVSNTHHTVSNDLFISGFHGVSKCKNR
jgi:hypothetical protein